jgi:hypothetical protein
LQLEDFARTLREYSLEQSNAPTDHDSVAALFAQEVLAVLTDTGEMLDPQLCSFRARGTRVDGYDYLEDSDEIDLFVVDFEDSRVVRRISSAEIQDTLIRCRMFLRRSLEGFHTRLDPATDAFALAQTIYEARASLRSARVLLLTNRLAPAETLDDLEILGIPVAQQVWDIERVFQVSGSGQSRPTLSVNFQDDFGGSLPCLKAIGNEEYDAYLLAIPASVLAQVYGRWGQRLLERNVRSFLQARGAVNLGIRRTLSDEPQMFFAYNNGISATADAVSVALDGGHQQELMAATNLQIVNGGQTTASTYEAFRRGVDLSGIYVPMKLTVLRDISEIDEVVPKISRYANSQTKVSFSDFSANDPFHLELEKISRETWAPNPDQKSKSLTRWFYERARGQYLDDRGRQLTPARRRLWDQQHPVRQKLTKTLVAKYEMTWQQQPHKVSEGSEKNFAQFSLWLQDHRPAVDDHYFQRLVAKAILFQTCDRIVAGLEQGGYKANVVTYTVSWLSFLSGQNLDLDSIWRAQSVSTQVAEALELLAVRVWEHLTNPPASARNVSEWSKKLACWEELKQSHVALSGLSGDLIPGAAADLRNGHTVSSTTAEVQRVPAVTWTALAAWGDETGKLKYWERGLAQSLADYALQRRKPTEKQSKQGLRIYKSAIASGFTPVA